MNISFRELDKDEAKVALEKLSESKEETITVGQLIKTLAFVFLVPTSLLIAAMKKCITGQELKLKIA